MNGTLSEGERPSLVSTSRSCLQCPCALCALFASRNSNSAKFTLLDVKEAILNLSPSLPQCLSLRLSPIKVYTMRIRSMKDPNNSKFVTMITLEDDCTVTIYDAKSCAIESFSKFDRYDERPELTRPLMVLPSPTISEDIDIIVNRVFDDALGEEIPSSQYSTPAPIFKVRPWTPECTSPKILPCSRPVSDIIRKFEEQTPPLPPIPQPRRTVGDRKKFTVNNKLEGSNTAIADASIRFFDSSNASLPVKRFESSEIHAIRKPLPRPRYSRRNALTVEDNPVARMSLLSRQSSPKQASPKATPSVKQSPAPMQKPTPKPVERVQSANTANGNSSQVPTSPPKAAPTTSDNTVAKEPITTTIKRKESDLVSIPKGYSSIMKVEDSSGRLEAVFGKPITNKADANAKSDGNIVRKNSSKRRSFLHNIQSRLSSTNGSRRKLTRQASSRTKADRKPAAAASTAVPQPQKPNQARPVISGPFIAVPNANGQFPPLLIPVVHTHPAHPMPQKRTPTRQPQTEINLATQGPNINTLQHPPVVVSAIPNPVAVNGVISNANAAAPMHNLVPNIAVPMHGVQLRNRTGSGSHQQSPNSANVVHEPVVLQCWPSPMSPGEGEYIAIGSRYAPSSVYSAKTPVHTSINPPMHFYPHPNRKSYPMKRESSYENCRIS